MGRPLGSYDSDELDRPDLNKCPDCGCYFATDECPLCGKTCPEEMRAGKRAAVKKPKKTSGSYSGRVQFIPWYYTWWFLLIMAFFMPLVGIILFITSPYSKKLKIGVIAGVLAWQVLLPLLSVLVLPVLLNGMTDTPVNDDISRVEYVERCESMDADELRRTVYGDSRYVTMELTVTECIEHRDDGEVYYICTDDRGEYSVAVLDCILEGRQSYLVGDRIRVWGQTAGKLAVNGTAELPGLYMAYCELLDGSPAA